MKELIMELVHLLRHGRSSVSVGEHGRVVYPVCSPLWVEVWMEKRLRLSAILFGDEAVCGFIRSLPNGMYDGEGLWLEYLRRVGK